LAHIKIVISNQLPIMSNARCVWYKSCDAWASHAYDYTIFHAPIVAQVSYWSIHGQLILMPQQQHWCNFSKCLGEGIWYVCQHFRYCLRIGIAGNITMQWTCDGIVLYVKTW